MAAFPADGRTGRELIATADVEMYRVKLASGAGSTGGAPSAPTEGLHEPTTGRHESFGVLANSYRPDRNANRKRSSPSLEEAEPLAD